MKVGCDREGEFLSMNKRVDKNWDLKDRCLEVMETWCNLMVASLFVREFYVVIFFYRFYSSLIR